MSVSGTQLQADRDRLFDDWSETVTLRRIEPAYDPDTQQIADTVTDMEISAVVGSAASATVPDAGGQAQTVDLTLQIKTEQFPSTPGDATWRVIQAGNEYDVVSQVRSPDGGVVELLCRKVG